MRRGSHKRKRSSGSILHGAIYDSEDDLIDEDYTDEYLHKQEVWKREFVEDDDDPTYMMFLKNLKPCGNAYMLDVSIQHGVSFPIRYEVEHDPPAKLNRRTPGYRRSALVRERKSLDLDGDMQSGQKNSAFQNENAQSDSLNKKRIRSALDHGLDLGLKDSGLAKENILRRSPRIMETFSNALRDDKLRLDVDGDLHNGLNHSGSQKEDTQSRTLVRKRTSLAVDGELNSSLRNSSLGKENSLRHSPRVVKNSLDAQKECLMSNSKVGIDETYRVFISGLKVVGDSVFYEYGDGKRVYYEENDKERPCDVEVGLQDTAPTGPTPRSMTPRPKTPPAKRPTPPPRLLISPPMSQAAKDDGHRLSTSTKKVTNNWKARPDYSWFWKAIEKDLGRPFEKKEYDDLLEEVNARKPVSIHRETRRGGYEMEFPSQLGKSYLDLYPDLNHEIEKVKSDPYRVLNLLRGFVLYLKKIPHGVPKPWMDEYCKTIMPGTRCA